MRFRRRLADSAMNQGFNNDAWAHISEIVLAAASGERSRFRHAVEHFATDASPHDHATAGPYLYFLLRYWVIKLVNRSPSADDLGELARRALDPVSVVLEAADLDAVACLLLSVFHLLPPRDVPPPGELFVLGCAVLGTLLHGSDPAANLEDMRGPLANYHQRYAGDFAELTTDTDQRE